MATTPQSSTTQPDSIENSDSSSAQRGTTTIPATVVAQVAAQAAFEFEAVGSNAGGVLGIGSRRNFASRPEARCELYGQRAILHLNLGLAFPTPLSSTVEKLRAHVSKRVQELCGMSVSKMSIEISWLNPSSQIRKSLK